MHSQPFARAYNSIVQKKIFWIVYAILGIIADIILPLWWALLANIPLVYVSWWIAYRSDWF